MKSSLIVGGCYIIHLPKTLTGLNLFLWMKKIIYGAFMMASFCSLIQQGPELFYCRKFSLLIDFLPILKIIDCLSGTLRSWGHLRPKISLVSFCMKTHFWWLKWSKIFSLMTKNAKKVQKSGLKELFCSNFQKWILLPYGRTQIPCLAVLYYRS